jgi:hypothetical protein
VSGAARPVVPPLAVFHGQDGYRGGSAVLAPQKPAQGLDTIEHLDFAPEVGCEYNTPACGSTPTHHVEWDYCHHVRDQLCQPHAEEVRRAIAGLHVRYLECRACGAVGRVHDIRVVPL